MTTTRTFDEKFPKAGFKVCPHCNETKSFENFHVLISKTGVYVTDSWCKKCKKNKSIEICIKKYATIPEYRNKVKETSKKHEKYTTLIGSKIFTERFLKINLKNKGIKASEITPELLEAQKQAIIVFRTMKAYKDIGWLNQ